jgi:simple sugar transport system permease protein
LIGVLILGLIQTFITFQGTLSSWWTKIAVGVLLFIFILMLRYLSKSSITAKGHPVKTIPEMQVQQA